MTRWLPLLLSVFAPTPTHPQQAQQTAGEAIIEVAAEPSGAFVVSAGGRPQFTHSPDDAWLKCAGCVVPGSGGLKGFEGLAPLTLSAHRNFSGADPVGGYAAHEWTWDYTVSWPLDPTGCNSRRWIHTLYMYEQAVRFVQAFPDGIVQQSNCECGGKQVCDCSGNSAWPALRPAADFGAYLWQGDFTGAEAGQGSRFNRSRALGGSAASPVALFPRDFAGGTWVISPAGEPRSAMGGRLFSGAMDRAKCNQTGSGCRQALTDSPVLNFGTLACTECPQSEVGAGFQLEALLSHSAGGVNAAMMAWGERMMAGSGKTRRGRRAIDFTLSHLGFSTDAGSYYYYYTVSRRQSSLRSAVLSAVYLLNRHLRSALLCLLASSCSPC